MGGTKDPHSAMPGGHSTLNTVVLGEGVSKSKYTPYFGHHSRARAAARGHYLREGPRLKGGYSGGSGSGVLPYGFLNLYGVSDCRFSASFS